MELAGGIFAALFGKAAAGTAAAAATTGTSTALKALAIGGGVLNAVAQIGAGVAARDEAYAQAKQEDFEARNEFIEGREAAATMKRHLLETISGQAVAYARGGVSLSSVSVQQAKAQATADAERELSVNSSTALAREIQRRRRAVNIRRRGDSAMTQSVLGAAGGLIKTGLSVAEIG